MRQPSLILNLDDKITNLIVKERREKRKKLLTYILLELERKGFDLDSKYTHSVQYEKVKNYSIDILTIRINDQIVLQEFPSGSMSYGIVGRKYKIFLAEFKI